MAAENLSYRPAGPDDVPALHALVEGAYRGESARAGWTHEADLLETPRTSAKDLTKAVADPAEVVLLAFDGKELVGCVRLTRLSGDVAYFGMLTVRPTRQAGGLGRTLIGAAEAWAKTHWGALTMELSVVSIRAELIAYYERRGYRLTGETKPFPETLDPPLVLAVMEKALG